MFKKIGMALLLLIGSTAFATQAEHVMNSLKNIEAGHYLQIDFYLRDITASMPTVRLVRSPSTYRCSAIAPNNQHLYQVEEILKKIPNEKGLMFHEKIIVDADGNQLAEFFPDEEQTKKNTRKKLLKLKRIRPVQEATEDIFWYINAENRKLEMFEGGDEMGTIIDICTWEALPANL